MHRLDGLLGLFRRTHGNETKTTRTSGDPVNHQVSFHHSTVGGEGVLEFVFRRVEREVSNK